MNGPQRTTGGFGAIDALDALDRRLAETHLGELLRIEGVVHRAVYRPGEVCRLLRISPTTLRQFCALAEHPSVRERDPRALDSFRVGCHHRIRHDALIDWLQRNRTANRSGS